MIQLIHECIHCRCTYILIYDCMYKFTVSHCIYVVTYSIHACNEYHYRCTCTLNPEQCTVCKKSASQDTILEIPQDLPPSPPSPQEDTANLRPHEYEDILELQASRATESRETPSGVDNVVAKYTYTQCPAYAATGKINT